MSATDSYGLQPTVADYHQAAALLWGEAGDYAVAEFDRINRDLFGGELPPMPIVIGLTAYGRCIGLTRQAGSWQRNVPRITLASNYFGEGRNSVSDVLVHEMLHAQLMLAGLDSDHNSAAWCEAVTRLSPRVVGREVKAAPVKPRRVDGKVRRLPLEGHLPRKVIARWPQSLRPAGWNSGEAIDVETY